MEDGNGMGGNYDGMQEVGKASKNVRNGIKKEAPSTMCTIFQLVGTRKREENFRTVNNYGRVKRNGDRSVKIQCIQETK